MMSENNVENQSDKNLIATLEDLGYLPNGFQGGFLFNLLEHKNPKIRLLAAKNIAKLNQTKSLEPLWNAFKVESDTGTRREIVSAIGRLRRPQNKPYLFEILQDEDPKVVCQAIRGLLVYDDDVLVERKLKPLLNHENETVRTVIYKEYFAEKTQSAGLKSLMITLCKIFSVAHENYAKKIKSQAKRIKKLVDVETDIDFEREIDFYLISNGENFKCEVKLMSKGNPESADAFIARGSHLLGVPFNK